MAGSRGEYRSSDLRAEARAASRRMENVSSSEIARRAGERYRRSKAFRTSKAGRRERLG